PLVQRIYLVGLVSRQARINVEFEQMVSGKAQVHGLKISQGADEQPSADEQQQAQSDLHTNEDAAETKLASRGGERLLFESSDQIGIEEVQGRCETERQ